MAPPLDWLVRALADRLGRLERRISLKGGAEGHALIRRHGQAFGAAWEAAGTILQASATADLTLTTSAQSIVGDGDSTKVRVLLPTPGDWNISAAFDLNHTVLGGVEAVGQLHVNDSASAETGAALLRDSSGQATVYQHWKVTTTVADTPVELKARKNTAAGTAYAMQTNTRLIASGGNGGGGGSGSGTDANAIHDNVSSEISAITEKASPVSADLLIIEDSAASNAKKRVQVGNLGVGQVQTINVLFDGGGAVLTTGMMGEVELPVGMTLTEWRCLLQAAENITITVTRATYAAYDTFSALSPALALSTSAAIKNQATGLTTSLTAGWILRFEITAAPASATWARAILKITRTP